MQLSGGYYGSWYENHAGGYVDSSVNGGNPSFTTGTVTRFALSLPLDNSAHQGFFNGGFNFTPTTRGTVKLQIEKTDVNVIDAVGRGTTEGLHLALNVGAMLISFLALVALLNAGLGLVGQAFGLELSLQLILGWVFAPIAWALGVPWHDAATVGNLLGTRMVLNEFIAFSQLGPLKGTLDPNSFTIATFALCGFANFSSIGIQIGGIGALAPERRHDLARLGVRAMLAGTFANFLTATIAGMLL